MISRSVNIPIIIVNHFDLSGLFQPDSDMIRIIETIPVRNERTPMILGNVRSAAVTLNGNPLFVIIRIFVIAKIHTKNEAVAIVVDLKM